MDDGLPYSQACENNKAPILAVLQTLFADCSSVLEVASGTGQHASHFAANMPWLHWQPTEMAQNLPQLIPRCSAYEGDNLAQPQALDVRDNPWSIPVPGGLFSANSLHIMSWQAVQEFFAALRRHAGADTRLAIYGPFNYNGRYTSDSNARFDQWLASRDPDSAIRDFEEVNALAAGAGFVLLEDVGMPANNRLLTWRRGDA